MRRKDRERDEKFALGVIDSAPYGVMALTDENGEPYAIPLSPVRIGGFLYFHSAHEGTKNDIIKNNPKAVVTFADNVAPAENEFTTGYDSAIVKGTVTEITDEKEKIEALRMLSERYCPANMERFDKAIEKSLKITAIFKMSMDEVTGKQKVLTKHDDHS